MSKKTFKDTIGNPAELFISSAQTADEPEPIITASEKPKAETKSKRLQLLVKPSILEALKQRAWEQHTSTNNLINEILENYINNQ